MKLKCKLYNALHYKVYIGFFEFVKPKPQTPKPQTPNPKPQTPNPKPQNPKNLNSS